MADAPNTIRVKLVKRKNGGVGFLIRERNAKPYVMISDLIVGGVAEASKLVQVGDTILRVNDIDVTDMAYINAVEILKSVPNDIPVVLLLRGPEGYTTHLETTFLENGMARTVRVTQPLNLANGIVNRSVGGIAQTPTPVASPRSHRSTSPRRPQDQNGDVMATSGSKGGKNSPVSDSYSNVQNTEYRHRKLAPEICEHADGATKNGNMKKLFEDGGSSPKILIHGAEAKGDSARGEVDVLNGAASAVVQSGKKGDSAIEIRQDSDEITVIVHGDVKLTDGNGKSHASRNDSGNGQKSITSASKSAKPTPKDEIGVQDRRTRHRSASPSPSRGSQPTCPRRYVKLKNVMDPRLVNNDILHHKAIEVGSQFVILSSYLYVLALDCSFRLAYPS